MDPIDAINIGKDTSFAILLEAAARQWELHYMELNDLFMRDHRTFANMRHLSVVRDDSCWYQLTEAAERPLDELDVVLMRKDPPFDLEYIYATYMLECAERRGLMVVNKPRSLRDANEKMFTAWFPDCCVPTLVARGYETIKSFLKTHGEAILKPLDGMGGTSIFHIKEGDRNLNVILETMTAHESRYVMAQRFIPEISEGDKRILMVNGEAVAYSLARIPAPGETRGNLAAGGRSEGRALTERDHWIAAEVGPALRERGLIFVGLDVIGDYLTEINVTSPTCVQELDKEFGLNISAQLLDVIEREVSN